MTKTRVPENEMFYYIVFYDWYFKVESLAECRANDWFAEELFKRGNYFHTEEEARAMIEKLNAVLKGAEVIEMTSDIEIKYLYPPQITNDEDAEFHEGMRVGVSNTIDVFKSKIVK